MNSNTGPTSSGDASIISVINATMNMVVKTSSVVVGKPAGITIKPNTNTIYITNTLSNTVSVLEENKLFNFIRTQHIGSILWNVRLP